MPLLEQLAASIQYDFTLHDLCWTLLKAGKASRLTLANVGLVRGSCHIGCPKRQRR